MVSAKRRRRRARADASCSAPRRAVGGARAQDRRALQPQPGSAAQHAQPGPQSQGALAAGTVDAAAALQPHRQSAPVQSVQLQAVVEGTFMAIS